MDELFTAIGIIGFIISILFVLVFGINIALNTSCNNSFPTMSHYYNFWSGCMVKVQGQWIPSDNFRILDK